MRKPFKVYKTDPRVPYALNRWGWSPGPWDSEPDRFASWTTASGLTGVIVRGGFGALCGYVRVPKGHPLYRMSYHQAGNHVNTHGGLTFASIGRTTTVCSDRDLRRARYGGRKGRSTKRKLRREWWLGFDCGHRFDMTPGDRWSNGDYRSPEYVREHVESLAAQLKDMVAPTR